LGLRRGIHLRASTTAPPQRQSWMGGSGVTDDVSRALVRSIEGEFRRYKALAEGAFAQMSDEELVRAQREDDNSAATIGWHIAGNLASRFTDFLTADGEKASRDRDSEFLERRVSRTEFLEYWERGWAVLFEALAGLSDTHLTYQITIRRQQYPVHEALHRSLAHASYHVGQIVYIAKNFRGEQWKTLSIPKGGSAAHNRRGAREDPASHAERIRQRVSERA
jgi:hypothetical protein